MLPVSAEVPLSSLYASLDVSLKVTSICVMDADGLTVLDAKVPSDRDAIDGRLGETRVGLERVGLEADPLSHWLYFGLHDAVPRAVCIEALPLGGKGARLRSQEPIQVPTRGVTDHLPVNIDAAADLPFWDGAFRPPAAFAVLEALWGAGQKFGRGRLRARTPCFALEFKGQVLLRRTSISDSRPVNRIWQRFEIFGSSRSNKKQAPVEDPVSIHLLNETLSLGNEVRS